MTSPNPEIHISEQRSGAVTCIRVRYRGWAADVQGTAVILPVQRFDGGRRDPMDLLTCLTEADALARRARMRADAKTDAPGTTECPAAPRADAARILRGTAAFVAERWHPIRCDIYHCLRQAWTDAGMPVAYADLTRALRAVAPQGNVLAHNDTCTCAEIVEWCGCAADIAAQQSPLGAVRDRGVA